jgi:hypothetical protein
MGAKKELDFTIKVEVTKPVLDAMTEWFEYKNQLLRATQYKTQVGVNKVQTLAERMEDEYGIEFFVNTI